LHSVQYDAAVRFLLEGLCWGCSDASQGQYGHRHYGFHQIPLGEGEGKVLVLIYKTLAEHALNPKIDDSHYLKK
jgi:hypothetical protein